VNCPSCGAPLQLRPDEDSFKCEYCRSVYLPEAGDDGVRVLGESSGCMCPACNVALVQAAIAKVRIEYCTHCHGTLIPMGAFEALIEEMRSTGTTGIAPPPGDRADLERRINCPSCQRRMDAHFYAGGGNVVIDSCENCAVNWLERGALMRIVRAPDSVQPAAVSGMVDDCDTAAALSADAAGGFLWSALEDRVDDF
jgi:Zn-finger nucleic acid-binding protein